jgi:hypothetical protein
MKLRIEVMGALFFALVMCVASAYAQNVGRHFYIAAPTPTPTPTPVPHPTPAAIGVIGIAPIQRGTATPHPAPGATSTPVAQQEVNDSEAFAAMTNRQPAVISWYTSGVGITYFSRIAPTPPPAPAVGVGNGWCTYSFPLTCPSTNDPRALYAAAHPGLVPMIGVSIPQSANTGPGQSFFNWIPYQVALSIDPLAPPEDSECVNASFGNPNPGAPADGGQCYEQNNFYLDAEGQALASFTEPVILRMLYEFDGVFKECTSGSASNGNSLYLQPCIWPGTGIAPTTTQLYSIDTAFIEYHDWRVTVHNGATNVIYMRNFALPGPLTLAQESNLVPQIDYMTGNHDANGDSLSVWHPNTGVPVYDEDYVAYDTSDTGGYAGIYSQLNSAYNYYEVTLNWGIPFAQDEYGTMSQNVYNSANGSNCAQVGFIPGPYREWDDNTFLLNNRATLWPYLFFTTYFWTWHDVNKNATTCGNDRNMDTYGINSWLTNLGSAQWSGTIGGTPGPTATPFPSPTPSPTQNPAAVQLNNIPWTNQSQLSAGTAISVPVTLPASPIPGDTIVAFIGTSTPTGGCPTVTTSMAGWAVLPGWTSSCPDGINEIYAFEGTAGASDSDYTFTAGAATNWSGEVFDLSNVINGIDAEQTSEMSALPAPNPLPAPANNLIPAPSVNASQNGDLVISLWLNGSKKSNGTACSSPCAGPYVATPAVVPGFISFSGSMFDAVSALDVPAGTVSPPSEIWAGATPIGQTISVTFAPATLPPVGMYNSCEIDTALTATCEPEDLAMTSDGYSLQINYNATLAYLTPNGAGGNSLQEWFAYDAGIGMAQFIPVESILSDSGGVLAGTALYTANNHIGVGCASGTAPGYTAHQNANILACIANVGNSSAGFAGFYMMDEPGCPNQSIGYCQGSLAGGNYANVQTLGNFLQTITTKPILGLNTPSGVPPACSGTWAISCGQAQINELFSWISNSSTPNIAFDSYPVCGSCGIAPGQTVFDSGVITQNIAATAQANYPAQTISFTGQAFSWYQTAPAPSGCTSESVCPYPTETQMQEQRDAAYWYGHIAGYPVQRLFWYYWPDITCLNTYSGCSSSANRTAVKTASFAAFPATPPPLP